MKESSFQWTCPACGWDQTETVTMDGPVMSLICEDCQMEFDDSNSPRPILRAWEAAIEDVIPRDE